MPNSRCSDHERLLDSLEWEGFSENKIKSDGNCQFRALADQLYKDPDCHKRVRQEIVKQLKTRPQSYKGFVGGTTQFSEYVKNMSNNGVWGDNLTLRAAADAYGVKIVVITSFKDTPRIEILPKSQKQPNKVIYLSFLVEYHYNTIYLNNNTGSGLGLQTDDTASMEQRKDKNNKEKKKNKKKMEKDKEDPSLLL